VRHQSGCLASPTTGRGTALRQQYPISRGKKQWERALLRLSTRWLLGLVLILVLATRVMVDAGPAALAQQPPCPIEVMTAFRHFFPSPDDQGAPLTASTDRASAIAFLEDADGLKNSTRDRLNRLVESFDAPITARIVEPGEEFLRYAPAATGRGRFFTKPRFDSPAEAWSALALRHSPGNDARFRQTVTVMRCTIVL
jgi:hypothetical protein